MTNFTNTNPPAWTNFTVEGHNNSQLNGTYIVFDSDFSGTGGDLFPDRRVDSSDIPAPLYKHSEREIYVTFNNRWNGANALEFWSTNPKNVSGRLTAWALDNASSATDDEPNFFYDENQEITTAPIPFTYTITEGFARFGDVEPGEPCTCENNANNISTLQAFTEVLSSNVDKLEDRVNLLEATLAQQVELNKLQQESLTELQSALRESNDFIHSATNAYYHGAPRWINLGDFVDNLNRSGDILQYWTPKQPK